MTARERALESLDELLEMIARSGGPTQGLLPSDYTQVEALNPDGTARVSAALRAAYTLGLVRARARVSRALPEERERALPDPAASLRSARAWRLAARDACAPFCPERAIFAEAEARSVTVTDAWGHKRVVGGFGDVGGP